MKKDKSILMLLLGFATPLIIMPIINEIVDIISNQCEIVKGAQVKKITEINIENTKLAEELENEQTPVNTQCFGFEVPNIEEEDLYEEE